MPLCPSLIRSISPTCDQITSISEILEPKVISRQCATTCQRKTSATTTREMRRNCVPNSTRTRWMICAGIISILGDRLRTSSTRRTVYSIDRARPWREKRLDLSLTRLLGTICEQVIGPWVNLKVLLRSRQFPTAAATYSAATQFRRGRCQTLPSLHSSHRPLHETIKPS